MLLDDKDQVFGLLKQLNALFNEQTIIIKKYTTKMVLIDQQDHNELNRIQKDYQFLSETLEKLLENQSTNQIIGRMLLNARNQAEAIVAGAVPTTIETDQEETVVELAVADVDTLEKSSKGAEIVAEKKDDSSKQLEESKRTHNKYIASLDNIVQEIDALLADDYS